MKQYPTIGSFISHDVDVHAFDKLDGSNVRAEWSKKRRGFYKFGSRNQLLDPADPVLGPAVELIREKYGDGLSRAFERQGYESAVCFFEFLGPSSFAGQHVVDEPHDVVLFDIAPYKKGLLSPNEFEAVAGTVPRVERLYFGRVDGTFERHVRDGTLPGMTFEGVVCKAEGVAFKLKSRAWLDRLREKCGSDAMLFTRLM